MIKRNLHLLILALIIFVTSVTLFYLTNTGKPADTNIEQNSMEGSNNESSDSNEGRSGEDEASDNTDQPEEGASDTEQSQEVIEEETPPREVDDRGGYTPF